jgi:TPP-dependent pyruvate/acetoin dehydrogenase alpha subunit
LPENPLLPHRKLRELHALMLEIRGLESKSERTQKSTREALLAATAMQLVPGDLLSARPNDLTAAQLAPAGKKIPSTEKKPPTSATLPPIPSIPARLPLCAAAARGLQAAGTDGLVLAFTQHSAHEPNWLPALEWAQHAQLPLILACTDPTAALPRPQTKKPTLDFATLSRLASRTKLAVLVVDGEDAVAVYRVMQESVIRARAGGGPAVIWAIMSAATSKLTRSNRPIARLEHYLTTRKITFKH